MATHNPYAAPEADPFIETAAHFTPDTELSVEYQLGEEDHVELLRHLHMTSPTLRRMRSRSLLFSIVAAVLLAVFVGVLANDAAIWMIAIVCAGVYCGYCIYCASRVPRSHFVRLVRGMLAENKKTKCEPTRLTIRPESVEVATSLSESRMKWPLFERLDEVDRYLYLFLSGSNAIVVPKAAFPTPEYGHRFVTAARSFYAQSQQLT